MTKIRVGLVFGGRSEEHEVSVMSARSVIDNVNTDKYEVVPFAISKQGLWLTPSETMSLLEKGENEINKSGRIANSLNNFLAENLDLVFPLLHGPFGEDGRIQGFFEMLDLPFVGAGVLASAVGMDKVKMKEIFTYHQLPLVDYEVLYHKTREKLTAAEIEDNIRHSPGIPCFVKPANMGSSIGIKKVNTVNELIPAIEEAFKYDNKILLEAALEVREIECSVLGNEKVTASRPGEVVPGQEFYNYEAKYGDKNTRLIIPADLSEKMIKYIQEVAIKAYRAIECSGFARVDFFLRTGDNKLFLNEINTIPGFTEYSMYPKLWEAEGISYPELIERLFELALEK